MSLRDMSLTLKCDPTIYLRSLQPFYERQVKQCFFKKLFQFLDSNSKNNVKFENLIRFRVLKIYRSKIPYRYDFRNLTGKRKILVSLKIFQIEMKFFHIRYNQSDITTIGYIFFNVLQSKKTSFILQYKIIFKNLRFFFNFILAILTRPPHRPLFPPHPPSLQVWTPP